MKLITYESLNSFAINAFNLVQPYFQYDWLMPRAFIAACPFGDLIIGVRNCPESSLFACWLLGEEHLPRLGLNDQVHMSLCIVQVII